MNKTILIIDDDKDLVRMISMRLKHEGYKIEVAFDALYGFTQAMHLIPDLILLDIVMPAGNGVGVLENLRLNVKTFNIPVVALTGIGDKQTKETIEKLGVSGYFVKPVGANELLDKLRQVLN